MIVRRLQPWLAVTDREWLQALLNESDYADADGAEHRWMISAVAGVLWACPGPRWLLISAVGYAALLALATAAAYRLSSPVWFASFCAMSLCIFLAVWCFALGVYCGTVTKALLLLLAGFCLSGLVFASWPNVSFPHDSYNAAVAWLLRGAPAALIGGLAIRFGLPLLSKGGS